MNKKRNILLGIGFLSLGIFAIIVTAMMYMMRGEKSTASDKNVAAYVATKHIAAGQKITAGDIVLRALPSDYVGNESLSETDIVDHYARVDIMKNDCLRFEKLSPALLTASESTVENNVTLDNNTSNGMQAHDFISIPLSVFKNPDTSLKSGESIDLVGLSQYGDEKKQFSTRYIALHILVGGFMKDGKKVDAIASVTVDEKTKIATKIFADEILLDMSPKEISRFLSRYYESQELNNDRAHNSNNLYQGHIWMIKSKPTDSSEAIKLKMLEGHPIVVSSRPKPAMRPLQPLPSMPKIISVPKGIVSYEH